MQKLAVSHYMSGKELNLRQKLAEPKCTVSAEYPKKPEFMGWFLKSASHVILEPTKKAEIVSIVGYTQESKPIAVLIASNGLHFTNYDDPRYGKRLISNFTQQLQGRTIMTPRLPEFDAVGKPVPLYRILPAFLIVYPHGMGLYFQNNAQLPKNNTQPFLLTDFNYGMKGVRSNFVEIAEVTQEGVFSARITSKYDTKKPMISLSLKTATIIPEILAKIRKQIKAEVTGIKRQTDANAWFADVWHLRDVFLNI